MTRDEVEQVHSEADQAYQSGDYGRAGDLFSSLLIEPEALEVSSEIQWNYALCLAHLGNWDLAIQHVQAAGYDEETFRTTCADTGLTEPSYAYEQAVNVYQQRDWDAAANAFRDLLDRPDLDAAARPELMWNLAMCLAHRGDFDEAFDQIAMSGYSEQDFRDTARQSGVDFSERDFRRASELYSNGYHEDAADAFAWMLLDPGVPSGIGDEIHWNLAMCQAHLGQWDAAFGHLQESHGEVQDFRDRLAASGVTVPDDR